MTTELTKAAQQALEALRANAIHYGDPLRCSMDAIAALERALTQRPAAQTERDTGPRVLREVFALCEDTMDKMAAESTEFSRGRAFEAKGISRAIGTWFQDEYCGQSHMGEPSLPAPQQATPATPEDMKVYDGIAAGYFADTQQATPEPVQLDVVRQAIEERDAMESRYHELAKSMTYKGNSVAWWHSKATAYRNAIDEVWSALKAAGIYADGTKTCADGVRELAATPEPVGEPHQFPPLPEGWPARFRCDSCDGNGEVGELVSMGHFQPPERQTCPDCGGRGWTSEEPAFNAEHMREFAEAHARCTHPAPGVPEGFTLDQIADACVQAEISDSKFESLSIALAAAQAKGAGQ